MQVSKPKANALNSCYDGLLRIFQLVTDNAVAELSFQANCVTVVISRWAYVAFHKAGQKQVELFFHKRMYLLPLLNILRTGAAIKSMFDSRYSTA